MLFGLCLVPDTSYDVFFLFYGDGGTGKSVAGRVLEALVGKANVSNLTLADFSEKHAVHLLTESLVNWVSDMPRLRSDQLQAVEGVLKQSTGGEGLKVERKNENPGKAPATARCIFATNNLPEFTDQSFGLWRRMRIIPFEQQIVGTDKQDRSLPNKLMGELPGIFMWAVRGLGELMARGETFPIIGRGKAIYDEHRALCDRTGTFLRETYKTAGGGVGEETKAVYDAYKQWSEDNGYRPKGMNQFVAEMRRVFPGVQVVRSQVAGDRKRIFAGLVRVDCLTLGEC
jgi:putative DNA primase/helicase